MSVAIPAPSRARMFQIGVNDWSGTAGNYTYSRPVPTIAAGMNLVLMCDDTDYITTNGLSVTAGAGTITFTATAHPDQLNVLVLPIPEANAAHVVIFPDAYSKGQVNNLLNGLLARIGNMRAIFYDRDNVTIQITTGGSPNSIDFSSAIPSGVSSPWAALVWVMHNGTYYSLPYITSNGTTQTWVYGMSNNNLLIHSSTTWANAHVYMILLTA